MKSFSAKSAEKFCAHPSCARSIGPFLMEIMKLPLLKLLGLLLGTLGAAHNTLAETNLWKFDFGPGKTKSGYARVLSTTEYSPELGYGFLNASDVKDIDRHGFDALNRDFCTSDKPFIFAVDVPEGNYRVTLTLGDRKGASTNTIKAEARRLMLEEVRTSKGKFATRAFVVNVRRPELKSGGRVRLKKDELAGHMDWDNQLELEFNGARPCVTAVEIEKVENVPVIYIAGDSTVCDQTKEPWCAWGQMLPRFFQSDIVVANHAESGESLKAFRGEKRAEKILDTLRAGDYLFIQFGHNDQKPGGAHADALTTYEDLLRQAISVCRSRGVTPVLVTPMNRRTFDEHGKITNSLGDYPEAVRQVAKQENVTLIDLNAMSKVLYETIGVEGTKKVFVHFPANTFPDQDKELKDETHFTNYGAYELARCVVEGIKESSLDLKQHLTDDAKFFDPAKPDSFATFDVPASPFLKGGVETNATVADETKGQ